MLTILLNYGAELGLPGCLNLAQVLERMTLRVPQPVRRAWKAARPKKTAMTCDQAAAIVAEGLARGTRRHRSIALGVAPQFELTLRQVDVIGEWERSIAPLLSSQGQLLIVAKFGVMDCGSRTSQAANSTGRRRRQRPRQCLTSLPIRSFNEPSQAYLRARTMVRW
jgi:hypothetical protein